MRRLAVILGALLLGTLAVATADGSRAPTGREAHAIRAAALRVLDGGGWHVTHIRVSTARTAHRYARANVDNPPRHATGGVMLLATQRGRWHARTIGTDGFCELTTVPQAVLVDLFRCPGVAVHPSRVPAGGAVTVTGRNWPAATEVEILLGPPRSEASAVGSATTTAAGRFTFVLRVPATLPPGRWVVLGCRNECRVKASASFTVTGTSA